MLHHYGGRVWLQPAGDSGDGMVETQPVRKRVAGSRRAVGSPAGPHAHGAVGSSGVSKAPAAAPLLSSPASTSTRSMGQVEGVGGSMAAGFRLEISPSKRVSLATRLSARSMITKDATYFELSVEKAAKALASAAGQGLFIIPGLTHGDIVRSSSEKVPDEFKWDMAEEFCIAEVMQGLFKQFGTLPAPYNAYQRFKTLINEWV
ncbi:hypothetical protein HaLaN_32467, partial [Haematococcus lacustris]